MVLQIRQFVRVVTEPLLNLEGRLDRIHGYCSTAIAASNLRCIIDAGDGHCDGIGGAGPVCIRGLNLKINGGGFTLRKGLEVTLRVKAQYRAVNISTATGRRIQNRVIQRAAVVITIHIIAECGQVQRYS